MASLLHHRHTIPELRSAVPVEEQVARLEGWLGCRPLYGTSIRHRSRRSLSRGRTPVADTGGCLVARFAPRPPPSPGLAPMSPDRLRSDYKDDKGAETTPAERSGGLEREVDPPIPAADSGDCDDGCQPPFAPPRRTALLDCVVVTREHDAHRTARTGRSRRDLGRL